MHATEFQATLLCKCLKFYNPYKEINWDAHEANLYL